MSKKSNVTQDKLSVKKRITRAQVNTNPALGEFLQGPLDEAAFRKSTRTQRSPTRPRRVPEIRLTTNEEPSANERDKGAIRKSVIKVEPLSDAAKKQIEIPEHFQYYKQSFLDLNQTVELERDERYSDFGGFSGEQSLILGTSKDIFTSVGIDTSNQDIAKETPTLIDIDDNIASANSNSTPPTFTENPQESNRQNQETHNTIEINNRLLLQDTQERQIQEDPNVAINQENMGDPRPLKLQLKDVVNYVPEYDGKNMLAAEYIKKLRQVRNLIEDADEQNLVELLKVRMKGEAGEALGSSNVQTIDDLIKAIRWLYPIQEDVHELRAEIRRIVQGDQESVVQYTNRICRLVLKIKEINKSENQDNAARRTFETELDADAARSFKKGLKSEIKYELGNETTLQDMSKKAIEAENDISRRKSIRMGTISSTYTYYEDNHEEPKKVFICQICRDFQHEALFCRKASCVYCKGADHLSDNCKNVTNKINLICKFCSQRGHSISACQFNKKRNMHCQYCQELGHEVDQCRYIGEYETCWKCKETGHDANMCKNKTIENSNKCGYCGNAGHTLEGCPDVICKKCNKKGHVLKFCTADENRSFFRVCTVCEDSGHDERDCEQVKVLAAEYRAKQRYKCQLCDQSGHTAKFCPTRMGAPQMQPSSSISSSGYSNYNSGYNNNFNDGFRKKFCAYCKTMGHVVKECRKLQALKNSQKKNTQLVCENCETAGHNIDNCDELLQLQQNEIFCKICKGLGHLAEGCRKFKNGPGNFEALSGGNA